MFDIKIFLSKSHLFLCIVIKRFRRGIFLKLGRICSLFEISENGAKKVNNESSEMKQNIGEENNF